MWGVLSISLFFLPFNRLIAWLVLAASAGMGMYHGVLTPLSLGCVLVIVALAGLRHHFRAQRNLAGLLEVLVVASCVALFLHLVPGFHNQLMIDGEKPGPLSAPFTMYYNFDKALVPFLLDRKSVV